MALTESRMVRLGTLAPPFRLPDTDGRTVSLGEFSASHALLVAFICNHCPYVKQIQRGFVEFAREYQPRGLAVVAISSNDVETHPQDGPKAMRAEAERLNYCFPYLYDELQEVAKAYGAECTPDFFLFDRARRLVYRGQFDNARPGSDIAVSGHDVRVAVDAVLAGRPVPQPQIASVGCNIKWKISPS